MLVSVPEWREALATIRDNLRTYGVQVRPTGTGYLRFRWLVRGLWVTMGPVAVLRMPDIYIEKAAHALVAFPQPKGRGLGEPLVAMLRTVSDPLYTANFRAWTLREELIRACGVEDHEIGSGCRCRVCYRPRQMVLPPGGRCGLRASGGG